MLLKRSRIGTVVKSSLAFPFFAKKKCTKRVTQALFQKAPWKF